MEKVDFVVTWVNPTDEKWAKEKKEYSPQANVNLNGDDKYRDWEIFKYWFRSIEKNAHWVNNIYLVTYGHIPKWLNTNNEKIHIIKHSDIMPKSALPTFNSNSIELCLHNIDNLSENFVYFNDDMFLNKEVKQSDFFDKGIPMDTAFFNVITPHFKGIEHTLVNNLEIINKHFSKREVERNYFKKLYSPKYGVHILRNVLLKPWPEFTGFYDPHSAVSLKKSSYEKVWSKEEESILNTVHNKFRTKEDLNFWLVRYWQICEGQFIPRSKKFSKMFYINDNNDYLFDELRKPLHEVICINDSYTLNNFKQTKQKILEAFQKKYAEKSCYEI